MPFLTHAGATLRYDRAGAGPTVLLIHGWLGNRTVWARQVTALRDRFTVVTVDLRGHGESSPPRTGYTIGGMAADLEQLVRALGVQRVALVGWSMGGMIALELARRLGARASALVLVGTSAGFGDPKNPLAQPAVLEEMRTGVAEDFRGFVRTFAARLFRDGAASPLLAWITGQMQKTPPHVAEACLDAAAAVDTRAKLASVTAPTLVVHGRHDAIFPVGMAEELAHGIRGAQLVVLEESGHSPGLEEPDRFNAVVGAFLANPGAKVATPQYAARAASAERAQPARAEAARPEKRGARATPKPAAKKATKASGAKRTAPKKKR